MRTTDIKRIAKLKGEKARTERREKLQAIVNNYKPGVQSEADPGTTSIATYLASFGLAISVTTLAQWLNLVPVLALELGSALAMVLVAAVTPPRKEPSTEPQTVTLEPVETRPERLLPNHSVCRQAVARDLMVHLENHGGTIAGNERSLARHSEPLSRHCGEPYRTWLTAGLITPEPTKTGTVFAVNTVPVTHCN